jgi:hypothetical protein
MRGIDAEQLIGKRTLVRSEDVCHSCEEERRHKAAERRVVCCADALAMRVGKEKYRLSQRRKVSRQRTRKNVPTMAAISLDAQSDQIDALLQVAATASPQDQVRLSRALVTFENTLDAARMDATTGEAREALRGHRADLRKWRKRLASAELMEGALQHESADNLMQHGLDVQQDSHASLARTLRRVEDARTIGADTVVMLAQQSDQLARADDQLVQIDTTLQRVRKSLARMARRLATDRLLWCAILLVLAVVIAIIVVLKVKH